MAFLGDGKGLHLFAEPPEHTNVGFYYCIASLVSLYAEVRLLLSHNYWT